MRNVQCFDIEGTVKILLRHFAGVIKCKDIPFQEKCRDIAAHVFVGPLKSEGFGRFV